MILSTSDVKGTCFIETKNLDGETNLKQKQASKGLIPLCKNKQEISHLSLLYSYEKPNAYLYNFSGIIKLPNGKLEPLNANNVILRGCTLRNTKFIYGIVSYTGHCCKIMLNSQKTRLKNSRVEIKTNTMINYIFFT